MEKNNQIEPMDYLKGRALIERLKKAVGVHSDIDLAEVYKIPKTTISTWKQRDLTPYELIIRTCLAKNISLEELALGKGKDEVQSGGIHAIDKLLSFRLVSGKAVPINDIIIDTRLMPSGTNKQNCVLYLTDFTHHVVDTSLTNVSAGRYVVDMDGSYSINKLQRIPGGKISIYFDDEPVQVDADAIKVIGKVVVSVVKE